MLSQHWPLVRVQDARPDFRIGVVERRGGCEREGVGMQRRSLITGVGRGRSVLIALAPQRDEVAE
ncbi:hypothetical protein DMX12_03985 [Pseudomonas sp. MB-090624]|nr:hypothetical protein DMX12_03985 [Pseudomonas sp. MB-090624]